MAGVLFFLLPLLLFSEIHQAEGDTLEAREAILRDLLTRSNPLLRPDGVGGGGENPVVVNVTYTLSQILDVDEVNGRATTSGMVSTTWHDPRLTFSHQNVSSIRLDTSIIWTPDIEVYNSDIPSMKNLNRKDLAVLYSTGEVFWIPQVTVNALCEPAQGYFYPSMNCSIRFGSWVYNGYKLDLHLPNHFADYTEEYIPTGRWRVTGVSVLRRVKFYPCCPEPFPVIDYTFRLARN